MMNSGMNKLILVVFNLIIILLLIISIFKGIQITDNIRILSYKDMNQKKEDYAVVVDNYNKLLNNDYANSISKLEKEKKDFEVSKQKYEQIRSINSYDELVKLTENKEYNIEYLWVNLDLIAKQNNLQAKFDIQRSYKYENYDINVTLTGDYLSVKNYIYDIMINMDLQFRADNIIIVADGDQNVKATFTISNVNIVM